MEDANRYPIGGDVITAVDGRSVRSMDELVSYLESASNWPGDRVTLDVLREGRPDLPVSVPRRKARAGGGA